ncbi:hypothetical protein BURPS406E_C1638 [Burkholderia pseudomallei 406e]|nr:hypothetical protein BURPS406E_C1638 [Burkholderia pseudomallei 406e]
MGRASAHGRPAERPMGASPAKLPLERRIARRERGIELGFGAMWWVRRRKTARVRGARACVRALDSPWRVRRVDGPVSIARAMLEP